MSVNDNTEKAAPRVLAVTSGKGGVGKTNLAVNLAIAMSMFDRRVMLVDADMGLGNVDVLLGLSPERNMRSVVLDGMCIADAVLEAMRQHPLGQEAAIIGEIVDAHPGKVFMRSRIGGTRVVDMLSGEQLPRIC